LFDRAAGLLLVSNYNYARYIGSSIQSALEQTYAKIELIICDDGSTDDSVRVIEEYEHKDPRLRFIRKTNGGQASGSNAAFAASRGEIVALLDLDAAKLDSSRWSRVSRRCPKLTWRDT